MFNKTHFLRATPSILVLLMLSAALFLLQWGTSPQVVRGKSAAIPLTDILNPEQALAQEVALDDARLWPYLVGERAEVMGVRDVLGQYTAVAKECATATCYQVEIYLFDSNATLIAIVNTDRQTVLDLLHLPQAQPGINKRLADRATDIARNAPEVIEALGFKPQNLAVAPVPAGMLGTACEEAGHLCAAPTFNMGDRLLWAIVDLTTEELVAIDWTEVPPDNPHNSVPFVPTGCPTPGTVTQGDWSLSYSTTGTDGFRVYDVTYKGVPVVNNIKVAEWHVAYSSNFGYVDSTGCGGGGGGFPIYPYGETEILPLATQGGFNQGFELVQDFRMSSWGGSCNYRYDQRIQFFNDGRFRVANGAYGKGCGTNGVYRPVVRIDMAVNGSANDFFASWDGDAWQTEQTEFWVLQDGPYTPDGYKWRVSDQSGMGYYVEPGRGQFGDGGRGDFAYLYVTQHKPNEGDTDLPVIGSCCNDNHEQGPHNYVNNESIYDENIVIWYVPQMVTEVTAGRYYCWTVQGEPNPETYPCYGGPMFVPVAHSAFTSNGPAVGLGHTAVFTNQSTGGLLSYRWDFGDGTSKTAVNPTHSYQTAGVYTVTLTSTNSFNSGSSSQTITVGVPPTADFTHNAPVLLGQPISFTNQSVSVTPATYEWDLGDGATSTADNPTHLYEAAGVYTVTLTVSNSVGLDSSSHAVTVAAPAEAGFLYQNPLIVGETAVFTDSSTSGFALSYLWDFGDGATSTAVTPTHSFTTTGSFTVTLTISNTMGETDSTAVVIDVGHAKTVVSPSASATLSYTHANGGSSWVMVPATAVDNAVTLLYTAHPTPNTAVSPPDYQAADHGFHLAAYQELARLSDSPFTQPLSVTFAYPATLGETLAPDSLRLYTLAGEDWLDVALGCDPETGYVVDETEGNTAVGLCTLGSFHWFGQARPSHIYLPIIIR